MNNDILIAVLIFAAFIALVTVFCYRGYKKSSAAKKRKQGKEHKYGATLSATLKHISGLPIARNLSVDVYYCPDKIVFVSNGQEIKVSRDKITGIDVTTGNTSTHSVMAGASRGKYLIGGKTGAAAGALASIKTQLVISYTSDNKNKNITLDTAASGLFASKVSSDFKKTSPPKQHSIEL